MLEMQDILCTFEISHYNYGKVSDQKTPSLNPFIPDKGILPLKLSP